MIRLLIEIDESDGGFRMGPDEILSESFELIVMIRKHLTINLVNRHGLLKAADIQTRMAMLPASQIRIKDA